jgi:hypothetical protein
MGKKPMRKTRMAEVAYELDSTQKPMFYLTNVFVLGVFQISVKLPHSPYKIQVMVSVCSPLSTVLYDC